MTFLTRIGTSAAREDSMIAFMVLDDMLPCLSHTISKFLSNEFGAVGVALRYLGGARD